MASHDDSRLLVLYSVVFKRKKRQAITPATLPSRTYVLLKACSTQDIMTVVVIYLYI